MSRLRLALSLFAALSLAALSGCRTAGVGDLTRRETLPGRGTPTAAELLVEHNRNAERVQSIEAKPSINVAGRRLSFGASGRMALERPRNFKLVMSAGLSEVADIGSNDKEFWFWVKDMPEKAVYFCNYEDEGSNNLAVGFQPDWIVEALGLRVIPETEMADITVTAGPMPGTWLLSQKHRTQQGETVYKETVLSSASKRIIEHRLKASDNKTLLTQAVISEYSPYPVKGENGQPAENVYLPRKFTLRWVQEKMALDVSLGNVAINQFEASRRDLVFIEPQINGIGRRNLAERAAFTTNDRSAPTSVRESMPAPPPRVRLEEPTPLGVDGAMRTPRDPASLSADLGVTPRRATETVVGPEIPKGSDPFPQTLEARGPGRGAFVGAIER